MNHIASITRTQVEMDQNTGTAAIRIRAALISLQDSYHRLEVARLATLAGCAAVVSCPSFLRAFQLELSVEHQIQTAIQKFWETERISWRGSTTFPEFPVRVVDDSAVTLELVRVSRFTFDSPKRMIFTFEKNSLRSTSEILLRKGTTTHDWKIAWIQ